LLLRPGEILEQHGRGAIGYSVDGFFQKRLRTNGDEVFE